VVATPIIASQRQLLRQHTPRPRLSPRSNAWHPLGLPHLSLAALPATVATIILLIPTAVAIIITPLCPPHRHIYISNCKTIHTTHSLPTTPSFLISGVSCSSNNKCLSRSNKCLNRNNKCHSSSSSSNNNNNNNKCLRCSFSSNNFNSRSSKLTRIWVASRINISTNINSNNTRATQSHLCSTSLCNTSCNSSNSSNNHLSSCRHRSCSK